jgi:hypothetical protein
MIWSVEQSLPAASDLELRQTISVSRNWGEEGKEGKEGKGKPLRKGIVCNFYDCIVK